MPTLAPLQMAILDYLARQPDYQATHRQLKQAFDDRPTDHERVLVALKQLSYKDLIWKTAGRIQDDTVWQVNLQSSRKFSRPGWRLASHHWTVLKFLTELGRKATTDEISAAYPHDPP